MTFFMLMTATRNMISTVHFQTNLLITFLNILLQCLSNLKYNYTSLQLCL